MNWFNISLKKYIELKDLYLDPEITDEDRLLYQIKILFDIDPLKLKANELHKYVNEMRFLGEKVPKVKLKSTYVLGENTYVLKKDLKDFSVAQWLDWNNFLKEGSDIDNYAKLLSVFFFPVGKDVKEYAEGYEIEQVRQDINNHLSIADANSIASFFLRYQKILSIVFLKSIKRKILKTPLEKKEKKKIKKEMRKLIWQTIFHGGYHLC